MPTNRIRLLGALAVHEPARSQNRRHRPHLRRQTAPDESGDEPRAERDPAHDSDRRPEAGKRKRSSVARILIAEDDPQIGQVLAKGLRKNGYSTVLADNGETAQSLSLTDKFDLLILDMGLPKRDGSEVLRELRSRRKTMPVLVVTGRRERDVVMWLRAEADDYMRKPFRFDELLARVEKLLRRTRTPSARPA
jgi:CheY-like chemotaxis protein